MQYYNVQAYTNNDKVLIDIKKVPASTGELELIMCLDVSYSMHRDLARLKEGIVEFFKTVDVPLGIQVFTFSCHTELVFQCDNILESRESAMKAVDAISVQQSTNMERVLLTTNEAAHKEETKPWFVFFTDGCATSGNTDISYLASLCANVKTNMFMFTPKQTIASSL